jgi:hypothetical protein
MWPCVKKVSLVFREAIIFLQWLLVSVRWCDIIIQTYALVYWFKAHFRGAIFVIG